MNRHRASLGMRLTAVVSATLLIQSSVVTIAAASSGASLLPQAQAAATPTPTPQATAAKLPNDQLDSLVAPIALYPDPLLAQVLAASTYPLEIVQLQQWMDKNPTLVGDALAAAVEKQGWDPSVQGLAGLHDVVKRLGDDIQWTADLGNAFLAQPNDVMDAVQRMRKKASDTGNLKTSEQLKVTTQVVQTKEVIVIQQADPKVIYVPAYNPVVVYGAPIYPYPPIYYPPPYYYGAMAIGFGVGIAMGAFWGGGWGYGPRWGYGSVNVNVNNRYVNHYNRNTNVGNINRGNGNWNHNPSHRGGAPYGDRATADRFGGSARGDSASSRQTAAQNRAGTSGRTQPSTGANRAGSTGANRSTSGVSNLSGSGSGRTSAGGDRVGNRSIPSSSNRSGNAFGGASTSRSTGSAARSASSRGSSSVGGSRSRGGGGGGRRR
jgi:hypothetical protein